MSKTARPHIQKNLPASIFLALFYCIPVSATENIKVVYPSPNNVIPASSTFIVGAIEPGHTLNCNNAPVRINELGFFAQVVPLQPGTNKLTLSLDEGKETRELSIQREKSPVPISTNEIKIQHFEPAQDLGLKSDDLISLSVHATPLSQVTVELGNHNIVLKEAAAKKSKANAQITQGQDVAYGETYQRFNETPSDLYTGFYRVSPEDHWQGINPKVNLTHGDKNLSFTPSTKLWTILQPAIAQTKHPQTIVRLGPGLARTTPLDAGVRVEVDGWVGTQMRCRYKSDLHVWIDQKDLLFETNLPYEKEIKAESTPAPKAVVRTINIDQDEYGQVIRIPLNQRLPYQVEQKSTPNSLVLKIYGATADTDWVTNIVKPNGNDADPIDHVIWKQPSDDSYEVTAYLNSHRQWGYKVYYDGTTLCLGVKRTPNVTSLSGLKICLDPGHGGSETGSIGCSGTHESEINLSIAKKLEAILKAQGAVVTMTRTSETENPSLDNRVNIAIAQKADILLSIHNNALPDGRDPWKEHGTSAYWYHPQAIELATVLKNSLIETLNFPDLGARYQNLALARPTDLPAVLVEVGFMINPDEFAKLIDPATQDKIAQALCDGLTQYIQAK